MVVEAQLREQVQLVLVDQAEEDLFLLMLAVQEHLDKEIQEEVVIQILVLDQVVVVLEV